jgi:50S ribosomal protein L16 3-hydroxylase
VKILRHFAPTDEWVLEPGDMLYLPPLWGHDGIAEDECMTCSVGFRVPARDALASELLQQIAEDIEPPEEDPLYRDPAQPATQAPAQIPPSLQAFAADALRRALADPQVLARALGTRLTEPKPQVWFDAGGRDLPEAAAAVVLDRRTRMMYDAHHVYVNGEAFRAAGADARLMRRLADLRGLDARALARASDAARDLLDDWACAGWLHAAPSLSE